MAEVTCILAAQAQLGEGAVWSARDGVLWWVDIRAPCLHRFDPATGEDQSWAMPESIGCVALGRGSRAVVALASGLYWFDPVSAALEPFLPIEADVPTSRLNDGRCDRQGRLWVGSMHPGKASTGSLYCCDIDQIETHRAVLNGIAVPNTIAFSLDGRTMYFADSPTRRIRAFDLDPLTGVLGQAREFATIQAGVPDGATVDADGCLWVACWDGWRLQRFRPNGELDDEVMLPVPRPTCCAFGGPDLGTMFVTTARTGLDEATLDGAPLSGGLFAFRPGVRGVEEPAFGVCPAQAAVLHGSGQ